MVYSERPHGKVIQAGNEAADLLSAFSGIEAEIDPHTANVMQAVSHILINQPMVHATEVLGFMRQFDEGVKSRRVRMVLSQFTEYGLFTRAQSISKAGSNVNMLTPTPLGREVLGLFQDEPLDQPINVGVHPTVDERLLVADQDLDDQENVFDKCFALTATGVEMPRKDELIQRGFVGTYEDDDGEEMQVTIDTIEYSNGTKIIVVNRSDQDLTLFRMTDREDYQFRKCVSGGNIPKGFGRVLNQLTPDREAMARLARRERRVHRRQ